MSTVKLSSIKNGSIIKIRENDVLVDFYVAKQDYESDLNGSGRVLVVRKDCYDRRQWHTSNVNAYASSAIDSWLNNTYKKMLPVNIRTAMGTTKIYYTPGNGNTTKATLWRSVFLLSATELGGINIDWINEEGTKLPTVSKLKIARLDGSTISQWTRSPATSDIKYVAKSNFGGNIEGDTCTVSHEHGSRPAFTLPSTLDISDDGSIYINTAPSAPASINVPENINSGSSVTVSWDEGSDAEGNLEGYIVERSTDGGSSWTQIYQGGECVTTNTVPVGTQSVMYRVKAYDTEGLQSGWRSSAQVVVINNAAPGAPAFLNVPDIVNGGESLTVTWGEAIDEDGNLAGYILERQVNGGTWTELYAGEDRAFADSIEKGWKTVAYRVKAYDSYNAFSSYITSDARTVNNNTAPAVSGQDIDLGLKTGSFSQAYTISDAESDSVTVTEYVDDQVIHSYQAMLEQEAEITLPFENWLMLKNGDHQLRVTAFDGYAEATRIWTFSKQETVICFRLAAPAETDTASARLLISPTWRIEGAAVKVEACNNAFDEAPAWEDITAMVRLNRAYNFTNKDKTADKWGIDVRFTIEKNEGYEGEVSITGFGVAYE